MPEHASAYDCEQAADGIHGDKGSKLAADGELHNRACCMQAPHPLLTACRVIAAPMGGSDEARGGRAGGMEAAAVGGCCPGQVAAGSRRAMGIGSLGAT